jgi:fumarate hydratase subunit beta
VNEVLRVTCGGVLDEPNLLALRAGDPVELTGRLITLRDASAALLTDALRQGIPPPVGLVGQVLYAAGPSPAKPGQVVGSAGPTTTARLERYLPALLAAGVRGVIGKGELPRQLAAVFVDHRAVYFAAIGGLGALLAKHIAAAEVIAYPELGPEAVYEFNVVNFPAVVIVDLQGRNFHETARGQWRRASGHGS